MPNKENNRLIRNVCKQVLVKDFDDQITHEIPFL